MKYPAAILFIACLLTTGSIYATPADSFETDTLTVEIKGTNVDARFEPTVMNINRGDVIQFVVREGLHTVTAYHPDNRRPLRMPESAKAFDSGLLKQGDVWFLQIADAGVYDYFCLPHERMGHAGRIISGMVRSIPDYPDDRIPEAVLKTINTRTANFLTK